MYVSTYECVCMYVCVYVCTCVSMYEDMNVSLPMSRNGWWVNALSCSSNALRPLSVTSFPMAVAVTSSRFAHCFNFLSSVGALKPCLSSFIYPNTHGRERHEAEPTNK